jgi:hypothetical protein
MAEPGNQAEKEIPTMTVTKAITTARKKAYTAYKKREHALRTLIGAQLACSTADETNWVKREEAIEAFVDAELTFAPLFTALREMEEQAGVAPGCLDCGAPIETAHTHH